jgi:tRNA-specific 2-thiouridylase
MSIAVAVSGGTDSLVTLSLLHEQGLEPVALHALFLPQEKDDASVRRILESCCHRLGIPLFLVDLRDSFRSAIVEPFVFSYAQGLTPNPCALCNQKIKFGFLRQKAAELGMDWLVTGHYARIDHDASGHPSLWRGMDLGKEQSYFLSLVRRKDLSKVLFPLGWWQKAAVARKFLEVFHPLPLKQESQEICFIPQNDYRLFVESFARQLPGKGPVKDSQGKPLGEHQGLHRYTIGQRRGLGIPYTEPLYVLDKVVAENSLIVGTRDELMTSECLVKEMNCIEDWSQWPDRVFVQTIYRQQAKEAVVTRSDTIFRVVFDQPRKRATPGQIATFYSEKGQVLGGGIVHA